MNKVIVCICIIIVIYAFVFVLIDTTFSLFSLSPKIDIHIFILELILPRVISLFSLSYCFYMLLKKFQKRSIEND